MTEPRASACTYFSVDIEASGPVPGLYNLVSLGATSVHRGEDGRYRIGDSFYAEFKPVFPGQDPGANQVHGLDPERLAREGQDPRAALAALSEYVARETAPESAPTFVGHVAVFDWMYVAWYYAWAGLPNPFGYKGLDTKSMAMGVLSLPWPETGKETLCARLGLAEQESATVHRADADAAHQARLLIALLERAGL